MDGTRPVGIGRSGRERLRAAGLDPGEISHEAYGNDEFALRDPDGYAIRFSSPRA